MPCLHVISRNTCPQPGTVLGLGDGEMERYRHRSCHPGAPVLILLGGAVKVVVCFPGKYQARILSESLLTPAEYQKEVNYELVTGKVDSLGAFFSTLCPGRLGPGSETGTNP